MNQQELRGQIGSLVEEYAKQYFSPLPFRPSEDSVPPSGKVIGAAELSLMVEAVLDGWLTTGRFNKNFEQGLAAYIGVKHLITVNSGSSANLVAFSTLTSSRLKDRAIKKGDEVITVAAGFPTTVNPIVQFGAIPVFVDIDIKTHNIDVGLLEAAISDKTRAVMIAHTLGNPFDLSKIQAFCKKYNLWLIEDCCDALGAKYDGKHVGTFGDIATLSFYPAHHITTGEGGAVFTNSSRLKAIAESFRDWGRDCYCAPGQDNTCNARFSRQLGELPFGYDHKYTYSHLGYNLKMTDMQAACGLAQLSRLGEFVKKRRENYAYLRNRLLRLAEFIEVAEATPNSEPSWFGLPLTIKEGKNSVTRLELLKFLDDKRVGTRLLFSGNLTSQPYFQNVEYRVVGSLTQTNRAMNQTFWIGVYPSLTQAHLDYAAEKIEEFFQQYSANRIPVVTE